MDETLVHCVNDLHADRPDLVLSIYFPDENETVNVISLLSFFRPASTCAPTFSSAWKRPTSSSRSVSLQPPIRPMRMPSWTTLIPQASFSASGSTETPACGPQMATTSRTCVSWATGTSQTSSSLTTQCIPSPSSWRTGCRSSPSTTTRRTRSSST
jgi:hypothetical protein